jgi:filamentous hemagglutinin
MTFRFGAAVAQSALASLRAQGSYVTYDYSFAGTDEEKRAWTAANTTSVADFFKTEFRTPSADEKLYNSVGQSDQIAKAQEEDARIGQWAILQEGEAIAGVLAVGAKIFGEGISAVEAAADAAGGSTGIPAWSNSEGLYSGGLSGYPATASPSWQAGDVFGAKATAETKPTSLTNITDEMKADPYDPDWQRYVGNEPKAVGADVVSGDAKDVVPNPGKTAVYSSTAEDGTVQYVGITDNLEARSAAHLSRKALKLTPYQVFRIYLAAMRGQSNKC